jgi:hypothetical protein
MTTILLFLALYRFKDIADMSSLPYKSLYLMPWYTLVVLIICFWILNILIVGAPCIYSLCKTIVTQEQSQLRTSF